ncbi:MAG TPA: 3-hexulose-6-phosphate synthase [Bacillales bacterium]|nr:3-hexulose-6-phosphate synthase [Bacillales bacterium]
MKLQLALDRITLEQALELARSTAEYVDIIEVGTSLIKDYGMESVRVIKDEFPDHLILADIKTMDEGEYEFRAAFQAGADIATVMAAAPIDTVAICYEVAEELGKQVMIDLLGVGSEKLRSLEPFRDAWLCVHAPVDQKEKNLVEHVSQFQKEFPDFQYVAVAGGVRLEDVQQFKSQAPGIIIVGSAITKKEKPEQAAESFYAALERKE